MSKASCGIAMGNANALAQRAADVVIIHDSLNSIIVALTTAKRTKAIIYQNVVGTLAFDAVGSLAAGFGFLGPVLAASLHGFWDIAFISNSARYVGSFVFLSLRSNKSTPHPAATVLTPSALALALEFCPRLLIPPAASKKRL
jgi:hypothetical protein